MLRHFKYLTAALLVINALSIPALAGAGPATLTCNSKVAKKTISLKGKVPGDEGTDVTLTNGNNTMQLNSDKNADAHVMEAFDQGVFTMIINVNKGEEELKLYALPPSIKAKKKPGSIHAKFDAVLAFNSSNPKNRMESVKMSCTYHYEI